MRKNSSNKSQYQQDKFIDFLFKKKGNGIFVDIGAHDGVSLSNSYFFEKYRNWKGLCIEPIPMLYEKLKENRSCFAENCCISDKTDVVTFRIVEGIEVLSGIVEFFDEKHLNRIEKEILEQGKSYRDVPIKCEILKNILLKYNIQTIDYCSIDTEGAEYQIISTIDFDNIHITSFSVENNNGDKQIRNYLKQKGYHCIKGICDDYFIKKHSFGFLHLSTFSIYVYLYKWKCNLRGILKKYIK